MKKQILKVIISCTMALLLVFSLSLLGCKTQDAAETTAAETEAETAALTTAVAEETTAAETTEAEKVTIRVLDVTWDPMQKLWMDKIIPEFTAAYPNVTVEYEWTEGGPPLREKIALAHTSGAAYDIFVLQDLHLPGLVQLNVADPFNPEAFGVDSEEALKDMYLPGIVDTVSAVAGTVYGVPVENSCNVFIYNPKHYEEIGRDPADAPETFEEMLDIAKQLTKRDEDGTMVRSGFMPTIYGGMLGGFLQVGPMIKSLGGSYFDETWTVPNFNTPEAVKAYQLYKDIFDKDKYGCAEMGFAIDENQFGADFVSGRISQIFGGAYMSSIFKGNDENFADYAYAPQPILKDAKESVVAAWGWMYCVGAASENKDLSWKLLSFVSSEKYAYNWMIEAGMFTGLKGDWLDQVFEEMPEYKVMIDALPDGSPALKTDKNDELEIALTENLERIVSIGTPIEESLETLQSEAEDIMSQE